MFSHKNDTGLNNINSAFTNNTQLCQIITSVSSSDDTITITFSDIPKNFQINNLHKALSLYTTWSGESIFYPPGSSIILHNNLTSMTIRFQLPIIDRYSATLQCSSFTTANFTTENEVRPYIHTEYPVILNLSDFYLTSDWSQLKCYHENYTQRWCEGRNLFFMNHFLFFRSPAHFNFPRPFIVPGGRAPPFDKGVDRLEIEPIVTQYFPNKYSPTVLSGTSFITGVYHNHHMMWHALFDFMLPLYHFVRYVYPKTDRSQRNVFVRSDGLWLYNVVLRSLTDHSLRVMSETTEPLIFQKVVLGIERTETDLRIDRTFDDGIAYRYNYDRSFAPDFRNDLLQAMNMPDIVGSEGQPLVLLIKRGSSKRDIKNIEEVANYMRETCSFCKVEVEQFQNMNFDNQIRRIAPASVLVGLHGSGLVHVLWMAASREDHPTHLIEIMPYNYSCRDWYQTAANVAGVEYHMVMNKNPQPISDFEDQEAMKFCWANPDSCPTSFCHDRLRDQYSDLEIDAFKDEWLKVVETLKKTKTTP